VPTVGGDVKQCRHAYTNVGKSVGVPDGSTVEIPGRPLGLIWR
jgi:hypothetical protein